MGYPIVKIKEGVVFKSIHFRPHITAIVHAAIKHAPPTTDGAIWITQAYRKIRNDLDFHEFGALDWRCRNILVTTAANTEEADRLRLVELGDQWADDMQAELGPDYDVIAHGDGDNFHVHSEFDGR